MNYNSTRNAALQVTAAQAIAQGISEAVSYTHLTLPTIA